MLKEHHDPHGLALGAAIGAFIAVLPLYGFHTVLCVAALFIVRRANKLAMLLATNISIPPTIAMITWTAYDVGRFVLRGKNYPPLSWDYFKGFNASRMAEFYYPLFIGSLVLGLVIAVALYALTRFTIGQIRKKRAIPK